MKISIIIPVWNEEKRIEYCLESLVSIIGSTDVFEIIISADGCTDRTVEIATKYTEKNPFIKLISFKERLGKGAGIINAMKRAEGDIYLVTDADLSAPPSQFLSLIGLFIESKADMMYGSRYLPGSKIIRKPPLIRILFGRIFNLFFRFLFKSNIRDTQCGFKIITKEVIETLKNKLYIKGFAFDLNLTIQALKYGFNIIEVPITWEYKGGSKINIIKQPVYMGRDLILLWIDTLK